MTDLKGALKTQPQISVAEARYTNHFIKAQLVNAFIILSKQEVFFSRFVDAAFFVVVFFSDL